MWAWPTQIASRFSTSCSVVPNIKNEPSYMPQRDTITKTIASVKIVQQQQQNWVYIAFSEWGINFDNWV